MALRRKKSDEASVTVASQPGAVIAPGSQVPNQESSPAITTPAPEAEPASPDGGLFRDQSGAPASAATDGETISWTASEFIAHQKSAGWYALLALGAIVIAALVYVLTKDKISTSVVLIGAAVLGFYGGRQPRQLEYQIDTQGIKIGQKHYAYDNFRSFAVVPEGAFSSIIFMPLKRFAPLTTIYYAPADEDRIVQLLSNILPIQEYRHDAVDQFMKRIRF